MAIDPTSPRTRRALLAAALGAGAASVAAAVGRPIPARAADGDAMVVGGEYTSSSVTKITQSTTYLTAIEGRSMTGGGVAGYSTDNSGVFGQSTYGWGVYGNGGGTFGVYGKAVSGTGVAGNAESGTGVQGTSISSVGVYGSSTTGIAMYASTPVSNGIHTGYALRAGGKIKLDNCAGVATIASGKNSITVAPGIDLTASSAVVATLQGTAGGTTTVHRCVVDGATNRFTIYLTANSTVAVKVAWHVFG